ncbi:MAG: hypothetical protein JKY88_02540, partial [Pseudomonadales bacterium]|nr:hypothetical protein [Pseudomonadales bacterium]
GSDITTTADNITFANAVILDDATGVLLDTGAGIGDVSFNNTLDGTQTLGITAGTGSVTFTGAVGNTNALAATTITSATNVTASSTIDAASLTQTVGTGTAQFSGQITTTNTTNLNSNIVQIDGSIDAGNSVILSGSTDIFIGSNITTAAADILFNDAVTLTGNASLNTNGTGVGVGDINFTSTLSGNQVLTIAAGSSTITFSGNMTIDQLLTGVGAYNVELLGSTNLFTQAVSFNNTGQLIIGNSNTDNSNFIGGITVVPTLSTFVAGTLSTVNQPLNFGMLTVVDGTNATLSTAGASVSITTVQGVAAAGAETLTVNSDGGAVALTNVNGTATGLTDLTIIRPSTVDLTATTLTGLLTIDRATGATSFNGLTQLNNVDLSGTDFNINADFTATGIVNVTNSGVFSVQNSTLLTATNGFVTSGDVNLATGIATTNAEITIGGELIVADSQTVTLNTANGDLTVSGVTEGSISTPTPESLVINLGTGELSLAGVFGANGNDSAAGLTDLTIVNSGATRFSEIDISGTLTQTNAATGNTVFNNTVSVNRIDLKGTNFTFGDFTVLENAPLNPHDIAASGIVSQLTGTQFSTQGALDITAGALVFNDLLTQGVLNLNVANDATISHTGALEVTGTISRNLEIDNSGGSVNVSGSVGRDLMVTAAGNDITSTGVIVTGASTFSGLSLNLSGLTATGDVVFTINDDVTINSNQAISLEGSASNLNVTTLVGEIANSDDLQISGSASFETMGAGDNINLNSVGNQFGNVSLTSLASVTLNESGNTELSNISAVNLTLNSSGAVTDGTNTSVQVSGATIIDANQNVTLGNELGDTIEFNTLEVSGADIVVNETSTGVLNSGLVLGAISADSLNVTTAGDLTSVVDANIIVLNQALFNAGASNIDLTLSSNAFSSVGLVGSTISIAERDATVLSGVTAAVDLNVDAEGEISDSGTLSVVGTATFDAGSRNITLDSAGNSFGVLNLIGGDIEVVQNDAGELSLITADQFSLTSNQNITQLNTSVLNISGNLILDSGTNNITLLQANNNVGGVDLTGSVVNIALAGTTRVENITADTLTLTAEGKITQNIAGVVSVTGLATFDSGTDDIALIGEANTFGTISLFGNSVDLQNIAGEIEEIGATDLNFTSDNDIVSAGLLNIPGNATFATAENKDITLTNVDNTFGTLSLTGGSITIVESGDTDLKDIDAGTIFNLTSTGNISDENGSSIDVTEGVLTATGNIVLGDQETDDVNFGIISLNAVDIELTESDDVILNEITTENLILTASGTITETSDAAITIGNNFVLEAGANAITLNNLTNVINNLAVTGAGDVSINNSTDTVLQNVSSDDFELISEGTITQSSDSELNIENIFSLDSKNNSITLDGGSNQFGGLELLGGDVTISESNASRFEDINVNTLSVTSGGNISQNEDKTITVDGLLELNSGGNDINLEGNANSFGSLNITANDVVLIENNDTQIDGLLVDTANIFSDGSISSTAQLTVIGQSTFGSKGKDISLSNSLNVFGPLSLDGSTVTIVEANDIELSEVKTTTLITLTTDGTISDINGSDITVTDAVFNAGDSIILGDNDTDDVSISNANFVALNVVSLNSSGSIEFSNLDTELANIETEDEIRETDDATIRVNDLTLSAGGNIKLDNGQNTFGRVQIDKAESVSLKDSTNTVLGAISKTTDFSLVSDGSIVGSEAITISGISDFEANGEITLNSDNNTFTGNLALQGTNVDVISTSNIELGDVNAANLTLKSDNSIVDNSSSTIAVIGLANIEARKDLSLGANGNEVTFGSVTLSGNAIDVTESDDAMLLDVTAESLSYTAKGNIDGSGGAIVIAGSGADVGELSLFVNATASVIDISNEGNSFDRLTLNGQSASAVVFNSNDTELANIDVQNLKLSVQATNENIELDVSDVTGDISVRGLADIDASGDINIGSANSADTVQFGSTRLDAIDINLVQTESIEIEGLNATGEVELTALSGDITANAGANVTVSGDTIFTTEDRDGIIDFSESINDLGELTLSGSDISVSESVGDITIASINATNSLTLNAIAGSIVDVRQATTVVVGNAKFTALDVVNIGSNGASNFESLEVFANSANIIESDSTSLRNLKITNDFRLLSEGSVSNDIDASIDVGGVATIIVDAVGGQGSIILEGLFGGLDVTALDVNLTINNESDNESNAPTLVARGLNVDADATNGSISLVDLTVGNNLNVNAAQGIIVDGSDISSQLSVANRARFIADTVTFEVGGDNNIGTLNIEAISSVEIGSSIRSVLADGDYLIQSNNVTLGADGEEVSLVTSSGSIIVQATEVAVGETPIVGNLKFDGKITLDSTSGGEENGAVISLMQGGLLSAVSEDGLIPVELTLNAGTVADNNISLGAFSSENRISALTIDGADNLDLKNFYSAGNTVAITVAGDITATGIIEDSIGGIQLSTTGGGITLSENVSAGGTLIIEAAKPIVAQSLTAGGNLNVVSPADINIQGDINTGGDLLVSAGAEILLGGNTVSLGTVSLSSDSVSIDVDNPAINVIGSITTMGDAGDNISISAIGDVNLNAITSAGATTVFTETGDLLFQEDVDAIGDFVAFSVAGSFEQRPDTRIDSGGNLTIVTQTGLTLSRVSGDQSVVLAINQTDVALGVDVPTFKRANPPLPFGSVELQKDVVSGGTISFLAPVANVGAAELGQSFVQSAADGIFYGLGTGKFFSDDIGSSQILNIAPPGLDTTFDGLFNADTGAIRALAGSAFNSNSIINNLNRSINSTGSAGQTNASSSSRSTAASQRDDEEDTAEVDELVFVQLNNYEQTPIGILLPEDQQVAYDDEGNIYYMVTMTNSSGEKETFPLYRVDLDLHTEASVVVESYSNNYETIGFVSYLDSDFFGDAGLDVEGRSGD